MFVKPHYLDRALGLAGAFGMLAVAVVASGALEAAPVPVSVSAADATQAVELTHRVEPMTDYVC